jgi:hypothetical protein
MGVSRFLALQMLVIEINLLTEIIWDMYRSKTTIIISFDVCPSTLIHQMGFTDRQSFNRFNSSDTNEYFSPGLAQL